MSDKEFFRGLREEIKNSTTKMLEQNEPPPELKPLEDDKWLTGPVATDPAEVDPGFEFVKLVPTQVEPKEKEDYNQQQKKEGGEEVKANLADEETVPFAAEREAEMSVEDLKKDILNRLETVKDKLKAKKKICNDLDGIKNDAVVNGHALVVEADDDCESVGSSRNSSKANANAKKAVKTDPQARKKYDEKAAAMKDRIKEIQNKIKNLSVASGGSTQTAGPPVTAKEQKKKKDRNAALKKADSASTLLSASESKQNGKFKPKKQTAPAVAPGPVPLTVPPHLIKPDNMLLLTLLTLDPKQRDDYLIKIGKERALLAPVPSKKQKTTGDGTDSVQVNPKFVPFAIELKRAALVHCYGPQMKQANVSDISRPFLTIQNAEKIQDTKKVWEARTFEDEVSYLLNNGKTTEKKDYKQELTLENVSKAEKNGYLTEQNKAALAVLVERLVKEGVGYLVEGVIRINQNNNIQAFVDDNTRQANVFINSILLRRCAMDGDYVKVFVKHSDPQPEGGETSPPRNPENKNESTEENGERVQNNRGFVVEILEKRHSRLCVGTFMPFKDKVSQYIKFAPRDYRIPCMKIFKQNWPEAIFKNEFKEVESVIYQAEIIEWHNDVPIANILKSIGKSGELEVESQAILVEYDLDVTPYSEEILNSLPGSEFQISAEEIAKREDLRDECIFTIDPLTARDLDDALSCKILKNGNYEIGVHISDVSYFLREGTDLDELVKLRATSIYMVDSVYHMLPKPLCFLCSLLPGEDKLAFSVFWEITPAAKVLKTRFAKTVINSCTQLAYEHAQIMLENPNDDLKEEDFPQIRHGYSPNYLSRIVNQLQTIAVQLRARRMENGCLKINQPKLSFSLDPNTGKPTEYSIYELRTANQMIEDFMLLANASVAEFTHSKFPSTSILRSHFAPQDHQMKNLTKLMSKHGHSLRTDSSKAIAESFEAIIDSCPNPDAARAVLNIMIAKPMTRARYFCSAFASAPEEFFHFALAIPMYTHFTSPIRRYADCLAHRVLGAALEVDVAPERTPEELSKLTGICNVKKYNAKLAGEASSMLYFKHYLQQVKFIHTEAAVLDIGPQQIELVLMETGHAIKVSYKQLSKSADFKITEEAKPIRHCILIPKEKKFLPTSLMLFSKVRVTVHLVKETLTIRSILPLVAGEQTANVTVAMDDSHASAATEAVASDVDSNKTTPSTATSGC
ncbi:DIS3-like exonuclease 2 [Ochlerotatus camptorhynchus]|uniref:DIS3-like exonuclease 2 n=1 Tax=Ochlerotatus camptorhynchus TaxID=644619 RepID=UPI0031D13F83